MPSQRSTFEMWLTGRTRLAGRRDVDTLGGQAAVRVLAAIAETSGLTAGHAARIAGLLDVSPEDVVSAYERPH